MALTFQKILGYRTPCLQKRLPQVPISFLSPKFSPFFHSLTLCFSPTPTYHCMFLSLVTRKWWRTPLQRVNVLEWPCSKMDGKNQYDETPPIFELGCVGRLVTINPLEDGRYNIVLQGLRRCTYLEQTVETSYRQAKVSLLSSQEGQELDTAIRTLLMESAERYLQSKKAHDLCQVIASGKLSDQTLVNSLSAGLDFTPVEKQFLLESDNLLQHARRLTDLIRFKLPNLQSPAQG